MSLQILCSIEIKSIAFNHEFVFHLIGMCVSTSVCLSEVDFLPGLFLSAGPWGYCILQEEQQGSSLSGWAA